MMHSFSKMGFSSFFLLLLLICLPHGICDNTGVIESSGNSLLSTPYPSVITLDGLPLLIKGGNPELPEYVRLPIRVTAGSPVVDLSRMVIRFSTGSFHSILYYQNSTGSQSPSLGNWSILRRTGVQDDHYLEYGELFDIGISIPGPLKSGEKISVELLPVDLTIPTVLSNTTPVLSDNITPIPDIPLIDERSERILTGNGYCYGGFSDGYLQDITIPLSVAFTGGTSINLNNAVLIWNNYQNTTLISHSQISYDGKSLISPGESTLMKVELPPSIQIESGESFSLEVVPESCTPILFYGSLTSGYTGGLILTSSTEAEYYRNLVYTGIKQSTSQVVLDGQIYGRMVSPSEGSKLGSLTFYLSIPEGGQEQDLENLVILFTANNGPVVDLSKDAQFSGGRYLGPSERVTVDLSLGSRGVAAGGSFTLEIKPAIGASTLVTKTLATGYNGGVII